MEDDENENDNDGMTLSPFLPMGRKPSLSLSFCSTLLSHNMVLSNTET